MDSRTETIYNDSESADEVAGGVLVHGPNYRFTNFLLNGNQKRKEQECLKDKSSLVFSTSAWVSNVCDLSLLIDPKPVTNKFIKTFTGRVAVTHVGKLKLRGQGISVLIYPVFYSPSGTRNLISASQLVAHGLKFSLSNNSFVIKSNKQVVMKFCLNKGVYESPISRNNRSFENLKVDWHVILGHPSDGYLKKFLELNGLERTFSVNNLANRCEICRTCKLDWYGLHNGTARISTNSPFERIHFGVFKIKPLSKGSSKFILCLVDDFSRFNRIYILKHKSQAQEKIFNFLKEIKLKFNEYPNFLCCSTDDTPLISDDSGVRYTSFGVLFERTEQRNPIVEEFNQILMVKIRCLLAQSSLPTSFWDEAATYSSNLINLLPMKKLNWESPTNVLLSYDMSIEPVRRIESLVPFGLKAHFDRGTSTTTISSPSSSSVYSDKSQKPLLLFLGFQGLSADMLRLFDPVQMRIVTGNHLSRKSDLDYNSRDVLKKDVESLPMSDYQESHDESEFF